MPNLNSPSARAPERRKTIRRRDAATSLDRLLDGAQATFAELGYHAATIHEICARARVGIGTFYSHFDQKGELLQQLMTERATLVANLLEAPDLVDRDRLVAKLRVIVDDPGSVGLWRAWHEAILEEPDLEHFNARWRAETQARVSRTLTEARKKVPARGRRVDAGVVAWCFLTLVRGHALYDRLGAPNLEELAALLREITFGETKDR